LFDAKYTSVQTAWTIFAPSFAMPPPHPLRVGLGRLPRSAVRR
jgi:hypothetical protein